MTVTFKSIPERFYQTLTGLAAQISKTFPVEMAIGRGEGYVVRINEQHPTPELRGIYFIFDPDGSAMVVSPEVAREMNARHIADFGKPWNNYTG